MIVALERCHTVDVEEMSKEIAEEFGVKRHVAHIQLVHNHVPRLEASDVVVLEDDTLSAGTNHARVSGWMARVL